MTQPEPLIIDRPTVAGETIEHDGAIIIKTPVADGITLKAKNGGIELHQGGGNNLTLQAAQRRTHTVISTGDIVGRKIIINGQVISGSTGSFNSHSHSNGVTVKGSLGSKASIKTDGSVKLDQAGDNLTVDAGGSITAANLGASALLDAGGSISLTLTGENSNLDAGGSIQADFVGASSKLDAGGSIQVAQVGASCVLDAGGSIRVGTVAENCRLDAGGSITIDTAPHPVKADAGGSVRIAGQKMKRDW